MKRQPYSEERGNCEGWGVREKSGGVLGIRKFLIMFFVVMQLTKNAPIKQKVKGGIRAFVWGGGRVWRINERVCTVRRTSISN